MLDNIIEWDETIMLDSFGNVTNEEFDVIFENYIAAVKKAFPLAKININLVNAYGCQIGINEVEFQSGKREPIGLHNERFFVEAMKSI